MQRKSSKRRIATESDVEEDYGSAGTSYQHRQVSEDEGADPPPRAKRPRVTPDMDVDVEFEEALNIEVVSEEAEVEPLETPQYPRRNSRNIRKPDYRALAGESSGRRKSVSSAVKPKRQVVYSDDEDEEEYVEERSYSKGRYEEDEVDAEEEYEPEPAVRSSSKAGKSKGVNGKGGKGKSLKVEEKEVFVRDERKFVPAGTRSPSPSSTGTKRARTEEQEQPVVDAAVPIGVKVEADKAKESTLPAFKKRKLPTIKKNKPPGTANGSTGPSTPVTRPPPEKPAESERLPLPAVRKAAAMAPNADFDLRDASVYASLFQKPGGTTPNSGLNRKEKEEERRRELNKMRDQARAKRMEEAKNNTFDLQAAHEKISRFEEKLHARKSMAVYPNILGATFKDMYDRKKRQALAEAQKERR